MSLWMPKKKPLYAPVMGTLGGASARAFGHGTFLGGEATIYYPDTSYGLGPINTTSQMVGVGGGYIGGGVNSDGTKYYQPEYNNGDRWAVYTQTSGNSFATSGWSRAFVNGLLSYGSFNVLNRPSHVSFYDSGNKATISGVDEGFLWRLSLSTAYDLATATVQETITSNWFSSNISGAGGGWFFTNDDFTKGLAKGYNTGDPIYRFDLNGSTLSSASNFTQMISGNTWNHFSIGGGDLSPDGRFLTDLNYGTQYLKFLDLGEGKDVFTATSTDFSNATIATGPKIQVGGAGASGGPVRFDWYNQAGLTNGKIRFIAVTPAASLGIGEIDHL